MTSKKSAIEPPIESLVPFSPCSNGEHLPLPVTDRARRSEEAWRRIVEDKHRRLGMTRREFAHSACGLAAALLVLDQAACGGERSGGSGGGGAGGTGGAAGTAGTGGDAGSGSSEGTASFYDVDEDMTEDLECAQEVFYDPDAFVLDVQTHTQTPFEEAWADSDPPDIALDYLKQIFVQGGTTVACISGIPSARNPGEGNMRARAQLREILERIGGDRMRLHCNIDMNLAGELDYMQHVAETFSVGAWKVYPYDQPWLASEALGIPFIEQARKVGVPVIAAHRGISSNGDYASAGSPRDLVQAASLFPDVTFLNYHAGWEGGNDEDHPYDPQAADEDVRGVDRLVRAMLEFGIPPNTGNVYAELGSTWHNLRATPEQAAHALGKLLLHVGEDRILYGTDSVFTGTPQGQIASLRTFQIPAAMRRAYGYPEITPEIRRKIFGLNAAPVYGVDPTTARCAFGDDEIEQMKMALAADPRAVPMPHPHQYLGPRNRRQFFAFMRAQARDEAPS